MAKKLSLVERLKKAHDEYNFMLYYKTLEDKIAIAEKYGFKFIASSGRVLLSCQTTKKYYKLDVVRSGNALRENEIYSKIQGTEFAERFAKVSLVADFALEVEFIKGESVYDFYDGSVRVTEVSREVAKFLSRLRSKTGINIDDIGGSNVMIECETERWVITDYAEDWGY